MKTRIFLSLLIFLSLAFVGTIYSQTRTVGLFVNDTAKTYKGYTLFAPKQNTMTYLINNEGRIINKWTKSQYPPGQAVYLLENGNLLRSCMTKGQLSSGGGEGGRVEEYDWNDNLVWQLDFSTSTYMQHHDIKKLPNGNVLMLVIEKKTYADCIAAGFDPSKFSAEIQQKGMLPDYIVEIKPTYPSGGTVVWEWHTWDHLIQDFSSTKSNFGVPKNHPELIDCDGDGRNLPSFWNHMNSIDYNPTFDQIAVSVRGNSEVWIIDHSTITAEAAGHSGGKRGKGGDLLYRWGNPSTYGGGTKSEQRYFEQHDVEWVLPGRPGTGNMTCFNNGLGRGGTIYSTVDEFTPNVDKDGNYTITTGSAYTPKDFTWTFKGSTKGIKEGLIFSENISGAYRLPNGNTIICSGTVGQFIEVTNTGEIVWEYICPVDQFGPLKQGDTLKTDLARPDEKMNSVFRVYKYPLDYAAFTGKTLVLGDFIELYDFQTYTLTVNSGSGTGKYKAGDIITVTANTPQSGFVFDKWTGDISALQAPASQSTKATMPAKSITITATYKSTSTETFVLTVNSGSGSGTYGVGEVITVIANQAQSGYEFEKWTGDTLYLSEIYNDTAKITMPNKAIAITANYKIKSTDTYTLTVNNGKGGGSYKEADTVTIIADKPAPNYQFDKWTGDITYFIYQKKDTAKILMPAKSVTITAEYKLRNGIDEQISDYAIIIPNPANEYLTIKLENIEMEIVLYSVLGEKLKSFYGVNVIDISDLQRGLYFIDINNKKYPFIKN